MENRSHAFRAHILQPHADEHGEFEGFELEEDHVVVVDEGHVTFERAIDEIRGMSHERLKAAGLRFHQGELYFGDEKLTWNDHVIAPSNVDTHTHMYQPTNLGGRLLVWLKRMFEKGEIPAKKSPDLARTMARERLARLAKNGTTRVVAWPTSSVESARIVLEEAETLGIEVKVSFVAMDQNVPEELKEDAETTLAGLEELFAQHKDKMVVIDRFPIAVSSELRQKLAKLAKKHGVMYEVHLDENQEEIAYTKHLYDGQSVTQILSRDGVLAPGMKVALSHAIHTTHQDFESLRWVIKAGCEIHVRACPNSNEQLESHWVYDEDQDEGGRYVPFPLQMWKNVGAIVTLATDLGAGNNFNLYQEMLNERERQSSVNDAGDAHPSSTELLSMGTVNGARSFGKSVNDLRIQEGRPAEFAVVRLGEKDKAIVDPVEQMTDRLIRGGARGPEAIVATYVNGRRLT